MSVKLKMQVALHRKDHDGSAIVRLHQVADDSIPEAQRAFTHQVIELHADSDEALALLAAPGPEEYESFVRDGYVNGQQVSIRDRKISKEAVPGAVVYVTFTAA